jgi:prevent-host-death family protein
MVEISRREVQSTEVGAQINSLLDDVERGESLFITRHGKIIAYLSPASERSRNVKKLLAEIDEYNKGKPPISLEEILSARHEGHKY